MYDAEQAPIAVGDRVSVDKGSVEWEVIAIDGPIIKVRQVTQLHGELAASPRLGGGVAPASVTRKIDAYRLTTFDGKAKR